MDRRPPSTTRNSKLFPYTTAFRPRRLRSAWLTIALAGSDQEFCPEITGLALSVASTAIGIRNRMRVMVHLLLARRWCRGRRRVTPRGSAYLGDGLERF